MDNGYVQTAEIEATNEDAPQIVKTYLWDPSEPVATRILHMNVWNNGTEVESLYYTHDLQKNVTALFGQAVERRAQYEYDPYGNPINTTGDAAALNPYRYSSEYHDEDLGLIYYNYRHYNPTDGRWTSRDPIAERGGINLYAFVRNRAGAVYDLYGLQSIQDWVATVIGSHIMARTDINQAFSLWWSALVASKGCIGIVGCRLGVEIPNMTKCYTSYETAVAHLKDLDCSKKKNMEGKPSQARMFSVHTYEGKVINQEGKSKVRTFTPKCNETGEYDITEDILDAYSAGDGNGVYDFALLEDGKMVGAYIEDRYLHNMALERLIKLLPEAEQEFARRHMREITPDYKNDAQPYLQNNINIRNSIDEWKNELKNYQTTYNKEFWCIMCEECKLLK